VESGAKVVTEAETFLDDAGAVLHVFRRPGALSRWMLWMRSAISLVDWVDFRRACGLRRRRRRNRDRAHRRARFDGGVQGEQVGLFRRFVDHFNDLADVIGAMAENIDDFGRGLNGAVGAVEDHRWPFPWSGCR